MGHPKPACGLEFHSRARGRNHDARRRPSAWSIVYGLSPDDSRKLIFRMRHVAGFPTLLPSTISVDAATGFRSARS